MFGNNILSGAGQQTMGQNKMYANYQHPISAQEQSMKYLIQNGNAQEKYNSQNSLGGFKLRQPQSYNDFLYSQNPVYQTDYAKMLDAQIQQKKQYRSIQEEQQRNYKNITKVNNINPHLFQEPNFFSNSGNQQNFGFAPKSENSNQFTENIFNPLRELYRTNPQNQQQLFTGYTSNSTNSKTKLMYPLTQNQGYLRNLQGTPLLMNRNTKQLTGSIPSLNQMGAGLLRSNENVRKITVPLQERETFFDKWTNPANHQVNQSLNYRGILKKENMDDFNIWEKERKQQELSQALQEQISNKRKRKEIEEKQERLEDMMQMQMQKMRSDQNNEKESSRIGTGNYNQQIKTVLSKADRLQQRNIISRRQQQSQVSSANLPLFDDTNEIPRTPYKKQRKIITEDGPFLRIEKIVDLSPTRSEVQSPMKQRESSVISIPKGQLNEVQEAPELDLDYVKDYYEFQKKVFSRQIANLQKDVIGNNEPRGHVFKEMLNLREKSKQEHMMNLVRPDDILLGNQKLNLSRKGEDLNQLLMRGYDRRVQSNPYLRSMVGQTEKQGYTFDKYYDEKQSPQLVYHSELIPNAQLAKLKQNKVDDFDEAAEGILGDMQKNQDKIRSLKLKRAYSVDNKQQVDEKKKNDPQKARNSIENEFMEEIPLKQQENELRNKEQRAMSASRVGNYNGDFQKFRKEHFNGKKLKFEQIKEDKKDKLTFIEKYIWDVMSQDKENEERDELDDKLDEFMGDIEKMIQRQAAIDIDIPKQTKVEAESQRKNIIDLKGKELKKKHLIINNSFDEADEEEEKHRRQFEMELDNISSERQVNRYLLTNIPDPVKVKEYRQAKQNEQEKQMNKQIPLKTLQSEETYVDQDTPTKSQNQIEFLAFKKKKLPNKIVEKQKSTNLSSRDTIYEDTRGKQKPQITGISIAEACETDESEIQDSEVDIPQQQSENTVQSLEISQSAMINMINLESSIFPSLENKDNNKMIKQNEPSFNNESEIEVIPDSQIQMSNLYQSIIPNSQISNADNNENENHLDLIQKAQDSKNSNPQNESEDKQLVMNAMSNQFNQNIIIESVVNSYLKQLYHSILPVIIHKPFNDNANLFEKSVNNIDNMLLLFRE